MSKHLKHSSHIQLFYIVLKLWSYHCKLHRMFYEHILSLANCPINTFRRKFCIYSFALDIAILRLFLANIRILIITTSFVEWHSSEVSFVIGRFIRMPKKEDYGPFIFKSKGFNCFIAIK